MNIATLNVTQKDIRQSLTVRITVPRLLTLRMRVGTWLVGLGVRVAGLGLKFDTE